MSVIKLISVLIGLFLALEVIDVARLMEKGDKFCRFIKYVLVIISAKVLIFDAPDYTHVVFGLAMAAFFWPRFYNRLVIWYSRYYMHINYNLITYDKDIEQ